MFSVLRYKNTTFILVYHRISKYESGLKSLYVSQETFEKQMKFLYTKGYKTISLDELRQRIKKGMPLNKMFCITFDDGYEDILNAYFILKKYNFKAIVYVHVNAIKNGYYTYPYMNRPAKMLSLAQLKRIKDVVEVGSHTLSHPDLSAISSSAVVKELRESKKFLETQLNVQVKHFCYPFGKVFNNYNLLLKKEGYETATTLDNSLIFFNDKNINFYFLPRIEWKELSSMSIKDILKNLDFYLKIFFGV